jgi:transcriptional regulator with XRE-family HTH domain
VLVAEPGRRREFRNGIMLDLPADVPIATCTGCGETYLTTEEAEHLEAALSMQLAAQCRELVETIQKRTGFSQKQIEAICGVTPTYLSHITAGRKQASATLLRLLECFALHPEEARRHQRGETWMTVMAAAALPASAHDDYRSAGIPVDQINERSRPPRLRLVVPSQTPSQANQEVQVRESPDVVEVRYWGAACLAR